MDRHFGFRPNLFSESALLKVTDALDRNMDNTLISFLAFRVGGGGVGSVMDCHSPRRDNAGSNPHATTDFSVTAEWAKTTHMLPRRSSINPDSRRTRPVNQE